MEYVATTENWPFKVRHYQKEQGEKRVVMTCSERIFHGCLFRLLPSSACQTALRQSVRKGLSASILNCLDGIFGWHYAFTYVKSPARNLR
jgi:hypothetical protein